MITAKITEKDSGRYEYISFPVNKYSFNDQLDRAGIFGEYTVEISGYAHDGLDNIEFTDKPDINELNFLAKRLKEICADKCMSIAYYSVISQHEHISMTEAINCTYGLDAVPVYPCKNAEEYGTVVLENDFLEEPEEIPYELYDLLDNEKVGKLMQEREGGVFVDGYYAVSSSYEPQLVYDGVLPETMDEWLFKLEVTVMDGDGPVEDMLETLTLPAGEERIKELEDKFGKPVSEWVWLSLGSEPCTFDNDSINNAKGVEQLNELAITLSGMSRIELAKFKAVMETEQPQDVSGMIDISASLDDYEFDPSAIDFKDYGEKYLSEMLPPDFDRTVISDGVTACLGRNISEKNGSQMTGYGMLSSAGGHIYSMIEAEQTQQQGQMMSL